MGQMTTFPAKASTATRRVSFDFISDLAAGEALSNGQVTVSVWSGFDPTPSSVVTGVAVIAGTAVTQLTTGGEPGTIYKLTCTATTGGSQVLVQVGYLAISDEPLSGVAPGSVTPVASAAGIGFLSEKAITILRPQAGDIVTLLLSNANVRVSQAAALLVGGTAPSATYTIWKGTDRTLGTAVVAGVVATSTTTGDVLTVFSAPDVVAGTFVWVQLTAVSGTPDEFNLTLSF